jgi:hypothetical protein
VKGSYRKESYLEKPPAAAEFGASGNGAPGSSGAQGSPGKDGKPGANAAAAATALGSQWALAVFIAFVVSAGLL